MEKIEKKAVSIILILAVLMFIALSSVKAQEQEGCCLDTGSQQCVRTTRSACMGRFYTGPPYDCSNVPECKPQTCIPKEKSQPCLRNKPVAECLAMDGVPDPRALEEIPQCKPGCCIIAKGVKAEILQLRQCENLTLALGYQLDMMEFKQDITSEVECKKAGSPTDLGCCVLGGGSCKYGARAECTEGNFVPLAGGLFCRDVAACALTSHSYFDCGKLPGTETDIYWFDSQGNQEELKESCEYPLKICTKAKEGNAFCRDTSCKVTGEAQKMSERPPRVEKIKIDTTLLTGTSICYNFYTHYTGKSEDESIAYLQGRSTGLQNQILHCSFGNVEIEALGIDRQKLCVPAESKSSSSIGAAFHANVKVNRWENCSKCGESKGFLGEIGNAVGDFLGPASVGLPTGKMFSSLFGDYCTKEKCEALGDCYFHEDLPGWLGGTPVGSCDPIYPPGSLASKCAECGGGGDYIWNLCTRAECYSKGDCQFKKASVYVKGGTFLWFWPGLAIGERISSIILECGVTTIYCMKNCAKGCSDPACLHPSNNNFFKCLGDRASAYAVYAPAWIFSSMLIKDAWNALSSKLTDTIINKATEKATESVFKEEKGKEGG
ncbi:MAG: hypothetical protein QXI41_01945 [Candidatus Pacearchaeota archaeon]